MPIQGQPLAEALTFSFCRLLFWSIVENTAHLRVILNRLNLPLSRHPPSSLTAKEVWLNGVPELDTSVRFLEKANWLQFQPIVKANQKRPWTVVRSYLSLKPISEQA